MRDDLFVYGRDSIKARTYFTAEQGSRCAICGRATGRLVVDHEHSEKGLCRGVLCESCNHVLGRFRDDKGLFAAAIHYLETHEDRNAVYAETEDWEQRRVKVREIAPKRPLPATAYERRIRNANIRAAIDEGQDPNTVAADFAISPRQVREIAYGR